MDFSAKGESEMRESRIEGVVKCNLPSSGRECSFIGLNHQAAEIHALACFIGDGANYLQTEIDEAVALATKLMGKRVQVVNTSMVEGIGQVLTIGEVPS
jgi:hypothetical protein